LKIVTQGFRLDSVALIYDAVYNDIIRKGEEKSRAK